MNLRTALIGLFALVIMGSMLLSWQLRNAQGTPQGAAPLKPHVPSPRLPAPLVGHPRNASPAEAVAPSTIRSRLLAGQELPKPTAQQLGSFLSENNRSVDALIGAIQASGDDTLLREARQRFPNDPRVAFMAWYKAESPDDRRQWVDAFKSSAPDNALGNFLSAFEYFKTGQSDAAVKELQQAYSKPGYSDYSAQFIQVAEEAYLGAGWSEMDATETATWNLMLPHLAKLKQLGADIGELAAAYQQSGDALSAQASVQMGLDLSRRMSASPNWILHQLVGLAVENQVLKGVDPALQVDALGTSAGEQLGTIQARRDALKAFAKQEQPLMDRMSEPDLRGFYERIKLVGEIPAIQWVRDKYAPAN